MNTIVIILITWRKWEQQVSFREKGWVRFLRLYIMEMDHGNGLQLRVNMTKLCLDFFFSFFIYFPFWPHDSFAKLQPSLSFAITLSLGFSCILSSGGLCRGTPLRNSAGGSEREEIKGKHCKLHTISHARVNGKGMFVLWALGQNILSPGSI